MTKVKDTGSTTPGLHRSHNVIMFSTLYRILLKLWHLNSTFVWRFRLQLEIKLLGWRLPIIWLASQQLLYNCCGHAIIAKYHISISAN